MTRPTVVKPRALKKGDLIGIIAPASPPSSTEKITKGAEYLERIGYRVCFGRNVRNVRGYLAGTDDERVSDLHAMFADRDVRAIIAVRGGYGTPRLLPSIDYSLIRKNPKILVGYSDLTGLQLAIFKKTGLVTFSGPMVGVEMFKGIDPFTEEHFWTLVTSTKRAGEVVNPDRRPIIPIAAGKASGRILGGNLSLMTSILGSPYSPSYKDAIVVIEDVDEEAYRFDRMMNQLRLAAVFKQARGIIVGELTNVMATDTSAPTLSADEVLQDYLGALSVPVVKGFGYGHVPRKLTVPIGIRVALNSTRSTVSFLESAVS